MTFVTWGVYFVHTTENTALDPCSAPCLPRCILFAVKQGTPRLGGKSFSTGKSIPASSFGHPLSPRPRRQRDPPGNMANPTRASPSFPEKDELTSQLHSS